jgi:hypothetical protein
MGRASDRLARHDPFGHLYLRTIMMVLASVATTSFSGPTSTRAVAITRPRGRFTSCMHHRFHRRRTSRSSSWPSPCSSSPTCFPRPRSKSRVDRRSSVRVRGESVMLLAFLRACRQGGHGDVCHA